MAIRYELILFEKLTYKGQSRHKTHKVGSAMPMKGGFMLFIPPGVSVSGRVMMVPDAVVWASAEVADALLVTRNTRDFPMDLPGIRVPYTL